MKTKTLAQTPDTEPNEYQLDLMDPYRMIPEVISRRLWIMDAAIASLKIGAPQTKGFLLAYNDLRNELRDYFRPIYAEHVRKTKAAGGYNVRQEARP